MKIKAVRVDFDKIKKTVTSHGLYSDFCNYVFDWLDKQGFDGEDFLTEIKGDDDLNEVL